MQTELEYDDLVEVISGPYQGVVGVYDDDSENNAVIITHYSKNILNPSNELPITIEVPFENIKLVNPI